MKAAFSCTVAFVVALISIGVANAGVEDGLDGKVCRAKVGGASMGAVKMTFAKGPGGLQVTYQINGNDSQAYFAAQDPRVDVRLSGPVTIPVKDISGSAVMFTVPSTGTIYTVKFDGEKAEKFGGEIDARPMGRKLVKIEDGTCIAGTPTSVTAEKN